MATEETTKSREAAAMTRRDALQVLGAGALGLAAGASSPRLAHSAPAQARPLEEAARNIKMLDAIVIGASRAEPRRSQPRVDAKAQVLEANTCLKYLGLEIVELMELRNSSKSVRLPGAL